MTTPAMQVTAQNMQPYGFVIYQVYINGVPYSNQPRILDAQLIQMLGQHDKFSFRIEYPPTMQGATLTPWAPNTPVSVLWGQAPNMLWWYGYIDNHSMATNADSASRLMQITYTCIGTSAVLNSVVNMAWQQTTASTIATTIAAANGLRAVVTPSTWVLTFEQQAESDFQFLNRIADKVGMRFWCSGGTIYMVTPATALEGSGQNAVPTFYANKTRTYQDTCRDFASYTGTNLVGSVQANRVLYGIDETTGTPFAATTPPTATTGAGTTTVTPNPNAIPGITPGITQGVATGINTTGTVGAGITAAGTIGPAARVSMKTTTSTPNMMDAQNRTNAWSARSQFWVGASATLYGYTGIYPGKLIQLAGSALPGNGPGFWLVSSATHNMASAGTSYASMDRYTVDVVLLKNANGPAIVLTNTTPVSPEIVTCALSSAGYWTATNLTAVVV